MEDIEMLRQAISRLATAVEQLTKELQQSRSFGASGAPMCRYYEKPPGGYGVGGGGGGTSRTAT